MSESNSVARRESLGAGKWKKIWLNNQGAILVLLAEGFTSAMDTIVRYLQQGEHNIHPFQLIFARMSGTLVLSIIYLWFKRLPHFPLGDPSVRPLLILRAFFGFTGTLCIYYSVHYLPLAEATIFRFLVPLVTAFCCSILLQQPFPRKDFLLAVIAMFGIVIIAHPTRMMGKVSSLTSFSNNPNLPIFGISSSHADNTSPLQRFIAMVIATLGIIGGAGAFTTIRVIGSRAHALHLIVCYAFFCTISSAFFLLVIPEIHFKKPQGIEWLMQIILAISGFVMQLLVTRGLQLDHSSKATSMMYSQILYAILSDWLFWGVLPDKWGFIGGVFVIGSTLCSALTKANIHCQKETSARVPVDEESPLLRDVNKSKTVKS